MTFFPKCSNSEITWKIYDATISNRHLPKTASRYAGNLAEGLFAIHAATVAAPETHQGQAMSQPAFDEQNQRIQAVPFVYPHELDGDQDVRSWAAEEERIRLETISRLLDALLDGARSPEHIGRRAAVMGFLVGSPSVKQRFRRAGQLARWLGVSSSALSQSLNKLRRFHV